MKVWNQYIQTYIHMKRKKQRRQTEKPAGGPTHGLDSTNSMLLRDSKHIYLFLLFSFIWDIVGYRLGYRFYEYRLYFGFSRISYIHRCADIGIYVRICIYICDWISDIKDIRQKVSMPCDKGIQNKFENHS